MSAVQYHYEKFPPNILDWEKLKDAGLFVELRARSGQSTSVLGYRELLNIAEGYDAF